ncbi:MAG: protein jag [Halanaerobiales bacterium]|nr:protein jag [Halanaerobiales bacterium]
MKKMIYKAESVNEAIKKGLDDLDIDRSQAEINIVEQGNKGFLGLIGKKQAEIEIIIEDDPIKKGKEFLEEVFGKTNIDVDINIIEEKTDEEQVVYDLHSPDLGIVIGRRGETLDALQYITSLVVNKNTNEYYRIILDAEGYRERRKKTLERLARKLAQKAVNKERKVVLEPMPPHERRIIHITLKKDSRVRSYSEGEEPFRKVMIETVD